MTRQVCWAGMAWVVSAMTVSAAVVIVPNFQGDYDPSHWKFEGHDGTDTYSWGYVDGVAQYLTLTGPTTIDGDGDKFTRMDLRDVTTLSGFLSFHWETTLLGNDGNPGMAFSIYRGGDWQEQYVSTALSGDVSGVWVNEGEQISFEFITDRSGAGKPPAQFIVSGFDLTIIPEAEVWWSAALLVGVSALEGWRRLRRRPVAGN